MKYAQKLHEGIFLKRYKRFFADIGWQGQQVVAHVPNTGSLKSVNNPGQPCLFSESTNPARKLKYTLEMIQSPGGAWVGVNTATPNTVVREALEKVVGQKSGFTGAFAEWMRYSSFKAEHKISAETRLDFALHHSEKDSKHFIEVKNVTLADGNVARFPDAVTERGQKHLRELMALVEEGHSAEILFTIQRADCDFFAPADDIDPVYGQLLREARDKGVRITPLRVDLSLHEAVLSENSLALKF